MDTGCTKNIGIFRDGKAIDKRFREGYRVTLIGKDVEALMNRVVNPKSKLCRYSDELTLVYAATQAIDGWLDDAAGIRQMDESMFVRLLSDNSADLYRLSGPHRSIYASRYTIDNTNVTLISCTPDKQENNAMRLPTLAGMGSDQIQKLIDTTTPSYPVLPYMNMHKCPITIDQADMGRISYPSTHLRSDTMRCKIMLPTANPGVLGPQIVNIFL